MWIQLLLIVAIVTLGFFVMRRTGADSHLAIRRIFFALFIVAAILSVLFPAWLTWFARLVGVGRGTDLLLYALVVVFLVFVYSQYRRNTATQRQLTQLARRVALLDAREREHSDDDSER
ncbi:DUF2304 domain-containing protein [Microbacterium aoyamense]|uniref:DUF2304 domain-containing protein n=1 Tax=Microbacterium aoyamense TaxID=344166 RepID=A0ABP5AZB9_9MICO|nr:DUF2304 domain-containing protein [Microbacterium aoyamense]